MPHRNAAVLDRMAAGFSRFQDRWCRPDASGQAPYHLLLDGQEPKAMVIACSDSRVDPAIVLDAEPGELFVVRNVGNLVPPYEPDGQRHGVSAALEYAVRILRVPDIIVMGHARCGGFCGMLERPGKAEYAFLDAWMETAAAAIRMADADVPGAGLDARLEACAMWGIRLSLDNLLGFPWIRAGVEQQTLRLHGVYFDLLHEALLRFDPAARAFVRLAHGAGARPETA